MYSVSELKTEWNKLTSLYKKADLPMPDNISSEVENMLKSIEDRPHDELPAKDRMRLNKAAIDLSNMRDPLNVKLSRLERYEFLKSDLDYCYAQCVEFDEKGIDVPASVLNDITGGLESLKGYLDDGIGHIVTEDYLEKIRGAIEESEKNWDGRNHRKEKAEFNIQMTKLEMALIPQLDQHESRALTRDIARIANSGPYDKGNDILRSFTKVNKKTVVPYASVLAEIFEHGESKDYREMMERMPGVLAAIPSEEVKRFASILTGFIKKNQTGELLDVADYISWKAKNNPVAHRYLDIAEAALESSNKKHKHLLEGIDSIVIDLGKRRVPLPIDIQIADAAEVPADEIKLERIYIDVLDAFDYAMAQEKGKDVLKQISKNIRKI